MYWYGEYYHTGSAIMDLGLEKNAQRTLIKTLDEMVPVFERLEAWMRFFGYPGRDKFAVDAVRIAVHYCRQSKDFRTNFTFTIDAPLDQPQVYEQTVFLRSGGPDLARLLQDRAHALGEAHGLA